MAEGGSDSQRSIQNGCFLNDFRLARARSTRRGSPDASDAAGARGRFGSTTSGKQRLPQGDPSRGLGKPPPPKTALEDGCRRQRGESGALETALGSAKRRGSAPVKTLPPDASGRRSMSRFPADSPPVIGSLPPDPSGRPGGWWRSSRISASAVAEGPEVEDEWHNFIGLNNPPRPHRPRSLRKLLHRG